MDTKTKRFLARYEQMGQQIPAYFAGMFQVRPGNIHSSEEVTIDIERSDEDVSIVVQDLSTGYRMNSADLYTNKQFAPPIHKEAFALNAADLLKRMAGMTTFEDPNVRASILQRMMSGMVKVQRKIHRAIELQASQVMQSGVVTLTDINGTALYTLDYKPKAAHFATVGTSWATATLAQKISDIEAACDVVRSDYLGEPDEITMGAKTWENLLQTDGFLARFDAQRANLGTITSMESRGGGGKYRGTIEVGNYKLDVFTYNGRYKNPQNGVSTPYMDTGKFLVRASTARLDATFGAIPNIAASMGVRSVLPELPNRVSMPSQGIDLSTNVWLSPDGEGLFGGVGSRPLMIPTAIDSFACFDTQL